MTERTKFDDDPALERVGECEECSAPMYLYALQNMGGVGALTWGIANSLPPGPWHTCNHGTFLLATTIDEAALIMGVAANIHKDNPDEDLDSTEEMSEDT